MAIHRTESEVKIVNGPSKFDLMLSVFEGKVVTFILKGGFRPKFSRATVYPPDDEFTCVAVATSVEREDGSNDSWNFTTNYIVGWGLVKLRGHFRTSDRKGFGKMLMHMM